MCSPSRYSLLTGRYNWRSTLQSKIVPVFGDPLIAQDRQTVAGLMREHGYHSACVGKWHLGMGWDFDITPEITPNKQHQSKTSAGYTATPEHQKLWQECFSKPTTGGPTTRGFDEYFGVDIPNWPPYCFIENDRTVGIPSEFLPSRLIGNQLASIHGPAMPYWHFEQLLPTFAQRTDKIIESCSQQDKPFFLYVPTTSPHTPLSVNKPFIGASGLNNLYADLVMETDAMFGQILDSLEQHGVADNTLVIFTSDNGFAHYAGGTQLEAQGHYPSGPYRGYKSDAWDGGHRMPFIARWPGVIEPGSTSDELICLTDLFATCAEIVDADIPDDTAEDSVSMIPILTASGSSNRDIVIHHSIKGKFAIRDGQWKLVLAPGSGGWTYSDWDAATDGMPMVQLYDMKADPGERDNLHEQHPEKVRAMIATLKKIVADGRSTPGAPQANDAEVDIWKADNLPNVDLQALDDY